MLYEKMVKTNENKDIDAFLDMIDEEFVMVSHQNKTERTKQEFAEMVRAMMSSDSLEVTEQRCIYKMMILWSSIAACLFLMVQKKPS